MAILVTEIMIAKSVLTMYASDVLAKTVEIKHYIEKIKEHEERRASTNERQAYWSNYFKNKK